MDITSWCWEIIWEEAKAATPPMSSTITTPSELWAEQAADEASLLWLKTIVICSNSTHFKRYNRWRISREIKEPFTTVPTALKSTIPNRSSLISKTVLALLSLKVIGFMLSQICWKMQSNRTPQINSFYLKIYLLISLITLIENSDAWICFLPFSSQLSRKSDRNIEGVL